MTETETVEMTEVDEQSATGMDARTQNAPVSAAALQAELDAAREALKKANKEAATRRKQLEDYEKSEREREEAELSEMDKLKRRLAETEGELSSLRIMQVKRKVARDVGLPDVLAERLQGDTEDAIKEDAERLLATLPKTPKAPAIQPTNPGANASAGVETAEQRRKRIFQSGVNIYDPARMSQHGGGVIINEK